jgi:hypothetical protein
MTRTHRRAKLLAVAAGFAIAVPAHGADPVDRWRVSTRIDMSQMNLPSMPAGVPAMPAMPTHVQEVCAARRNDAAPVADRNGQCKITNVQRVGNRQTMDMDCGQKSFRGTFELVYDDADHYHGRMQVVADRADLKAKGLSGSMYLDMQGERIGRCDGGSDDSQQKRVQQDLQEPSCSQRAAAFEYASFLGAQPRCTDSGSVQSFCNAVKDFDGFLGLGSHENDDELSLKDVAPALRAAMVHPLTAASRLCSFEIPPLRVKLCQGAEGARKFAFLLGQCPAQSDSLAQRVCGTMDGTLANSPYGDFCPKYAALQAQWKADASQANAAGRAAQADAQAKAAAEQPKAAGQEPATIDKASQAAGNALDKGKDVLKSLFGN